MRDAGPQEQKGQAGGNGTKRKAKAADWQSMAIGMWRGMRARAAAAALGLRKGALNVVVGLTAIMAAWLRCVGLALARARARAV